MEIKVTSCSWCIFRINTHCRLDEDIPMKSIRKSLNIGDKNTPSECPLIKGEVTVKLELTQNPSNEG